MNIYLDNCCYGRYLDDLSIGNNQKELEAISYILLLCDIGTYNLGCSDVSWYEAGKNSNPYKKQFYHNMLERASFRITITEAIINRAKTFENNIRKFDSRHLAAAETQCELFFTVDEDFNKKAQKLDRLNIGVYNPLYWERTKYR